MPAARQEAQIGSTGTSGGGACHPAYAAWQSEKHATWQTMAALDVAYDGVGRYEGQASVKTRLLAYRQAGLRTAKIMISYDLAQAAALEASHLSADRPNPRHLAYHEAGHAVMCRYYKVDLYEVSIERDAEGIEGRLGWKYQTPTISQLAEWIRMFAAGEAAQTHAHDLEIKEEFDQVHDEAWADLALQASLRDRELALRVAAIEALALGMDPETWKFSRVSELWKEARAIIKQPRQWRAVEALATALLDERTIDGTRAQAIIDAALTGGEE